MSADSKRLEFLGELAGGLAHEIKNPLSTMRLHLEMLEEDWGEVDDELGKRSVRKVGMLLREIHRLDEIVQEFLKISRGHDLRLTATDIRESLENLVELVTPEAKKFGVSLHLQVLNQLGTALVDENYFHRAILNLVQNAIQACEPKGGGDVIIEVGRSRGAIGISIVDTGVGIEESLRDRIFRAYFTSRPGGTGMGLPLTRRIIEEHGGYIAFDSVVDQGSRFMVMLPVGSGDPLSQVALRPEESGESRTIDVSAVVNEVLAESKDTAEK